MIPRKLQGLHCVATVCLLLGWGGASAFLGVHGPPTSCSSSTTATTSRGLPPLASSKWNPDPTVNMEIKQIVEQYRQKKHQATDTPDRFMADGVEALKSYDLPAALQAFDTALDRNNQSLCWHRGAVLYFMGRLDEAITHLDRTAEWYERRVEKPATEERVWRAAALYRLKGEDAAKPLLADLGFGGENRKLMLLVYEMFRGRVEGELVDQWVRHHATMDYGRYDLYGNFYLGLYCDAKGWREEAVNYMTLAINARRPMPSDVMHHLPRLFMKHWGVDYVDPS